MNNILCFLRISYNIFKSYSLPLSHLLPDVSTTYLSILLPIVFFTVVFYLYSTFFIAQILLGVTGIRFYVRDWLTYQRTWKTDTLFHISYQILIIPQQEGLSVLIPVSMLRICLSLCRSCTFGHVIYELILLLSCSICKTPLLCSCLPHLTLIIFLFPLLHRSINLGV